MKRLRRTEVWFALGLLAVAGVGAVLLACPACTQVDSRDLKFYWARHYWRCAFDAVSATCGAGLLTYRFDSDYTARGRWTLTGIGLAGAMLYLAVAAQVAGRLRATTSGSRLPRPAELVVLALLLQIILVPLAWLAELVATGGATNLPGAAWRAAAAFLSLGWIAQPATRAEPSIYAVVVFIGALGWPAWMVIVPPLRRRYVYLPSVALAVAAYAAFLLAVATLIFALETTRDTRRGAEPRQTLAGQSPPARYARSLVQAVCASGAGAPTEWLAERDVSEGTKITLAATVLIGGMGGSPGGGLKWPLLLWAVTAAAIVLGRTHRRTTHPTAVRPLLAGTACLLLMLSLATAVALGLLLIEAAVASPFQSPHTFADAFLDACSAVAGGNLSSGLTASVTAENLSSGMQQAVDLYGYGMAWLVLAMLAGRVLPVLVLRRVADMPLSDTAAGVSPLI